jgi:hypothetical protein
VAVGKAALKPEKRAQLLERAEELGLSFNKESSEHVLRRIKHIENLSPLRVPHTEGHGNQWDWPRVIDIVTERILNDPVRGLKNAVLAPWVDPETNQEWPLPNERKFYEASQRNPAVRQAIAYMRRLQAQAIPERLMNDLENLEEWVQDDKGARQNTAGVSKMKLKIDLGMRLAAHYDEEFIEKTKTEVEVRDQQLKDVIQQGLPALEDMKR